ncbi:MAG: hypothetical protein HZB18_06385 [Chloroflexi bacterium]|nr:hypothetical protein [Chloroflexota bacterium]
MFDNLREQVSAKPFSDEEEAKFQPAAGTEYSSRRSTRILGMTPIQRFVIVVMLFMAVCVIGALTLLVTGKIGF